MNWALMIYFLIACALVAALAKWVRSGKDGKHWRDDEELLKKHGWKSMDNYNEE